MEERTRQARALRLYFVLTYAAFLLNTAVYYKEVSLQGPLATAYFGAVHVTYSLLYLVPVGVCLFLLSLLTRVSLRAHATGGPGRLRGLALPTAAVLGFGLVQLYFFADRFVFHIFGFHLASGFVRNLVVTRGGLESMGGDDSTEATVAIIAAAFIALQVGLWWLAAKLSRRQRLSHALVRPRSLVFAVTLLVCIGLFERATYAVSSMRQFTPVLTVSSAFPFYLPFTCRKLGRWLGIAPPKGELSMQVKSESIHLKYPLAPLRRAPDHSRPNIVWLVSESLRWDMLDPEIMPATWAFAHESAWFQEHYSGGNGTRMGVFSLFYGLYGPYWFPFLNENRGPVLIDLLLEDRYQMELFTSARFTYPEFDKTVWANVPREHLHEAEGGQGWQRDRKNVDAILDFIEGRDPQRPFMTFLFFESPHARYHFPPETAIRSDYLEEVNYATLDLERDVARLKNRYINSCRHLDTQIERLLERLRAKGLLDSTIVLITGDHGEEFMERGRWGHNSAFSQEQIRVPFVLRVPGRAPEVIARMTSHLDVPATICRVLGVENPTRDYTLGHDLFGPGRRDFTILADWTSIAYVDDRFTGVFPLRSAAVPQEIDRGQPGHPPADPETFRARAQPRLLEVMQDLKRFSR